MTSSNTPLAVVLLAAGKGTRMLSDTHKVLHPVGGRPMLINLLDTVAALGAERTVLVVGDKADQVEKAVGDRAAIAVQQPQLGTGHAVQQAETALSGFSGNVLVLYGDVPLIRRETLENLLSALDGPRHPAIAVLGFRPAEAGAYGRILVDGDGYVSRMVEARDATPEELEVRLCNSGILACRSDRLFALLKDVGNDNAAKEYYLPDIVMLARSGGGRAVVVEAGEEELLGVNSRADLALVEAAFQRRRRSGLMAAGVTMIAPETVFLAADTDIGRDCLIEPNVVFGPGVSIGERTRILAHSHIEGATVGADCQIGPFARLRPGTVIGSRARVGNFVETKKLVLGDGAKANHLSYLGDAEVGAGANIGAGTITCNYDGFGKYRTAIGENAFIGSNSALVAPVSIGAGAIVGAGSTITRDVAADALGLARGRQEEKAGWARRFRDMMQGRKTK